MGAKTILTRLCSKCWKFLSDVVEYQLKMFLQPNLNIDIGFYYEICSLWEYLVVALSKLSTECKRPCWNRWLCWYLTEHVKQMRNNWYWNSRVLWQKHRCWIYVYFLNNERFLMIIICNNILHEKNYKFFLIVVLLISC